MTWTLTQSEETTTKKYRHLRGVRFMVSSQKCLATSLLLKVTRLLRCKRFKNHEFPGPEQNTADSASTDTRHNKNLETDLPRILLL